MPDEEIQVETAEEEQPEVTLTGEEEGKEEIPDPGQLEGKPKVEIRENEPGPETPRFKKVYARLKGAEETIEKLKADRAADEAVREEIRKHNAQLAAQLEKLSTKAIEAVESHQDKSEPSEIVSIRKAIVDLEARKEEAVENLKGKEVVQIDKELRKLERVLDGYEYHVRQREAGKRKEKESPKPSKADEPDPDIVAFEESAKDWYGKDPIMTGAAKEYDLYLSQQPEWKNKPFGKRLQKVKEDIEAKFNTRQAPKPKPPGAESGIGLQRTGALGGVRTVRLTQQQAAVADGLGISREDYARQLNFLGGEV